jgi:hypothetical protein
MNLTHNYIGPDELIYNNEGEIHSGGFSVNSIMLKNGLSPIITLNQNNIITGGGNESKVSDLFNNLVVPNWSLSYNYKNGGGNNNLNNKKNQNEENDDDLLEDSLHDKLLNLVKVDKNEIHAPRQYNKKLSKKNFKQINIIKNNITKKHKKK